MLKLAYRQERWACAAETARSRHSTFLSLKNENGAQFTSAKQSPVSPFIRHKKWRNRYIQRRPPHNEGSPL